MTAAKLFSRFYSQQVYCQTDLLTLQGHCSAPSASAVAGVGVMTAFCFNVYLFHTVISVNVQQVAFSYFIVVGG
jgi:hypothetical protein